MEIGELTNKFGLSRYEKQAYLALLILGRSKSREVSKESKVSYGRIYEILEKLEQRGLVSIIPTEPKTFEAIEPRLAFKMILEQKKQELKKLEGEIKDVKIPLKKLQRKEEDKTLILHGTQKYMGVVMKMNEDAKNEMLSIPGIYTASLANKILYQRALKRGVKCRKIVRFEGFNKQAVRENIALGEEIRQNELKGLRLKIVDRNEALLSIVDPISKDRISIYTTNKDFANSMAIFFESLWDKSKQLKS